jgi:predicted nucleic acid-binding protein
MKYLLDVSTLIALIWPSHVHHSQASVWRKGKHIVLCPITELGFIRVSTSPAFNASMADARKALKDFLKDERPEWIPADLHALEGDVAPTSAKTTDWYLANLAAARGMQWATLDQSAKHSAAELIH